jgi:hypothetical protein
MVVLVAVVSIVVVQAAVALAVRRPPAPQAATLFPPQVTLPDELTDGVTTLDTATIGPTPSADPGARPSLTTAPAAQSAPTPAPKAIAISATSTAPTPAPTPTPTPNWTTLTVEATKVRDKGDSMQTNRTRLLLQSDGDLAIVDENGVVRWHSGTAGTGDHAVFQNDGHFVVYNRNEQPRWSSGNAGRPGAVLVLGADRNVTIVFNAAVIWSSNTTH